MQGLPADAEPIFIIPWNETSAEYAARLRREMEETPTRTWVKHHVFPRAFKKWFTQRGVNDCLPRLLHPACRTCGRHEFSFPPEPILDAATVPENCDLFRVANFQTLIVGTERFVETVRRLGFEGVAFQELPTR